MASVTRSYRIRAYPNGAQRRLRDRWFGAYRWLWNTALEIRTEAYRECGLTLTGNDISRWLTQWKRTPGHEWLAQVPAGGSLRFQDAGAAWRHGILSLPKLGVLKLAEALPEVERPDLVTLSHDAAGRYFVSFSGQMAKSPPQETEQAARAAASQGGAGSCPSEARAPIRFARAHHSTDPRI